MTRLTSLRVILSEILRYAQNRPSPERSEGRLKGV